MGMVATIKSVDFTGNHFIARGTIALAGSYPGSGNGDVLSFVNVTGPVLPSSNVPDDVQIYEAPAAGTAASGLVYVFAPGTTQANGKVQVFATYGTQAGNVTYASLNIVNLSFTACFSKNPI
jgi:hypothetical protein